MVEVFSKTATGERPIASAIVDYCAEMRSTGLISENAYEVIKEASSLFALSVTPFFCFEIPLHLQEDTTDFLFCISNPAVLSASLTSDSSKQLVNKNPFYKRLLDFALKWQGGKAGLECVQNIWLEFDYVDMKQGISNPAFFYAPKKAMNALRKVYLTDIVFETVASQPLSKEAAKTLLLMLAGIPPPAWVSQIGKMLSRSTTSLRLFIQNVGKGGAQELLKAAGYKQVNDLKFALLLNDCSAFADQVDVDIDIEESGQVGPVVGLECSFNHLEKALGFLGHLYVTGICKKHKHDALFNFLRNMQWQHGRDYQPFLAHFKLVYQGSDMPTKVKAYVGYAATPKAPSIIRTQIV